MGVYLYVLILNCELQPWEKSGGGSSKNAVYRDTVTNSRTLLEKNPAVAPEQMVMHFFQTYA